MPQKVYTVIKNRPDSLQRQKPPELSNSKAIHQAGQHPPEDSSSFIWDWLAQTHQNQQVCRELAKPAARKVKPSMPIKESSGLVHPGFLWSRSLTGPCNCCLIGELWACPSNRCKFPLLSFSWEPAQQSRNKSRGTCCHSSTFPHTLRRCRLTGWSWHSF